MDQNYIVPMPEEVSKNQYTYRYNLDLCKEKGLTEGHGIGYYYLCLQAVYRANLDAYLLDVIDLKILDKELKNSKLGFASRRPEDKNLYEKESTMDLEFICLRNNLYIEYLDENQLRLLKSQLEEGRSPVTDELKALAKETCQEVIRVRDPKDWKDQKRFLYPKIQGSKPEIPNQALVLEISNAMEFDASGSLLNEEYMREKWDYLDKIKAEKEKEYSEILGMEVYILVE